MPAVQRTELTRRDVYVAVTAAILTAAGILFVAWLILWLVFYALWRA
jgi:hypothetical protein